MILTAYRELPPSWKKSSDSPISVSRISDQTSTTSWNQLLQPESVNDTFWLTERRSVSPLRLLRACPGLIRCHPDKIAGFSDARESGGDGGPDGLGEPGEEVRAGPSEHIHGVVHESGASTTTERSPDGCAIRKRAKASSYVLRWRLLEWVCAHNPVAMAGGRS